MQEIRLVIRRLSREPAATVVSLAALACSIGAAAAAWSLLSAVLLQPIPVPDSERWFTLTRVDGGIRSYGFVYPVFERVRNEADFESVAAVWSPPELLLLSGDRPPTRVAVGFVTHDLLALLDVGVPLGRGFRPEDDRRGAPPVAILLDRFWRRTFNADRAVIGHTINLGGKPVTIVGVAASGFRGIDLTATPDLYLPLNTIADVSSQSTNYLADPSASAPPTAGLRIVGRLRKGEQVPAVAARLSRVDVVGIREGHATLDLTSISEAALPPTTRPGMIRLAYLLLFTVALLLLAGCGTVGLFVLGRVEAHRADLATRLALGASVLRLIRGVVLESAVLSGAGALFAFPAAALLLAGLRTFQLPGEIRIDLLDLAIGQSGLLVCFGAGAASLVVVASVAGAFGISAGIVRSTLAPGGMGRATRRRTRSALVIAQVCAALVLLCGATLFVRSLQEALDLNPVVGMDRVLTADLSLPSFTQARADAFCDELRSRLSSYPGVRSIAYSVEKGGMGPRGKLLVDGVPRGFPSIVRFTAVDPPYFGTMGMTVTEGRDFSTLDTAGAPGVAIVSASFARMLGNGKSAIGVRITMPHRPGTQASDVGVVGVVLDIVSDIALLEPLALYVPIAQRDAGAYRSVAIRADTDISAVKREVLNTARQLDPSVEMGSLLTLSERIGGQMGPQRLGSAVLGALGVVALLLAMLGMYVQADSMATLRMREMAIRAALGATGPQLAAVILVEVLRLVGFGLAVGLLFARLGAETVRALLFRVQPLDPYVVGGVATMILMVALAVSLRPAFRASKLDLVRLLKYE